MSELKREYMEIKATSWWSLFLAELKRRMDTASKHALSDTDAIQIYRSQGAYRVLSGLLRSLNDPDFLAEPEE